MIDILILINQLLAQRYFGPKACARALLLFFNGTVNTAGLRIIQKIQWECYENAIVELRFIENRFTWQGFAGCRIW